MKAPKGVGGVEEEEEEEEEESNDEKNVGVIEQTAFFRLVKLIFSLLTFVSAPLTSPGLFFWRGDRQWAGGGGGGGGGRTLPLIPTRRGAAGLSRLSPPLSRPR